MKDVGLLQVSYIETQSILIISANCEWCIYTFFSGKPGWGTNVVSISFFLSFFICTFLVLFF